MADFPSGYDPTRLRDAADEYQKAVRGQEGESAMMQSARAFDAARRFNDEAREYAETRSEAHRVAREDVRGYAPGSHQQAVRAATERLEAVNLAGRTHVLAAARAEAYAASTEYPDLAEEARAEAAYHREERARYVREEVAAKADQKRDRRASAANTARKVANEVTQGIGSMVGGALGAAAGAVTGFVVPVPGGTITGAAAGGAAGGKLGTKLGTNLKTT
jgi:hypothetical protein